MQKDYVFSELYAVHNLQNVDTCDVASIYFLIRSSGRVKELSMKRMDRLVHRQIQKVPRMILADRRRARAAAPAVAVVAPLVHTRADESFEL